MPNVVVATLLHDLQYPHSWLILFSFFFNDTATTEIYTLSLHDALPISSPDTMPETSANGGPARLGRRRRDRKSTRLNSSHVALSRMPSSACKKTQSRRSTTPTSGLRGPHARPHNAHSC